MTQVVVTGGAGFIGHHLVAGLIANGHLVTVIDDLSSGHADRIAAHGERVRLVTASILDRAALDDAVAGADIVFHLAAIASVARSFDEPEWVNAVNVRGTIEVIQAAARAGARRIVAASSSAVYGTPLELPCREQQRADPISPYGAGKLAAEHYLHALGRWHGLETVALRYFNVFGPGQDPASEYAAVVPRFITAVAKGAAPLVNGSGEISRDYIYVGDVVQANLLAAARPSVTHLTCNVARGRQVSLIELLDLVYAAVGRRVAPIMGPPRAGDVAHSVADVGLASSALGFVARTPLDIGLRMTVDSFRERDGMRGEQA